MVALAPAAGDHHRFDVREVGVQGSGDRVVGGPEIEVTGVDGDEVGLAVTEGVSAWVPVFCRWWA